MRYRYYSTQRPVMPGSYPKNGKVVEIKNFDSREMVGEIGKMAWGYIDYSEPLPTLDTVQYELSYFGKVQELEDKQNICDLLLKALQATRGACGLVALDFDPKTELVTGIYKSGGKVTINVACDSGVALIRDIMKKM